MRGAQDGAAVGGNRPLDEEPALAGEAHDVRRGNAWQVIPRYLPSQLADERHAFGRTNAHTCR